MQDVISRRIQIERHSARPTRTHERDGLALALMIPLAMVSILHLTLNTCSISGCVEARILHPMQFSSSNNRTAVIKKRNSETEPRGSVEFHSPMKRIMELVGNHAPRIIVGGEGQRIEELAHHQTNQQAPSYVASSTPMQTAANGGPTRWLLSSDTLVQQPQQIYADSVPYEQYYQQIANSDDQPEVGGQVSLMPPHQLNYNPETGQYQPVTSYQYAQEPQVTLQQASVQQHQQPTPMGHQQASSQWTGEPKGQPIFLSSYVPASAPIAHPQSSAQAHRQPKTKPRVAQESEPQEEQQPAVSREQESDQEPELEPASEGEPQSGSSSEGGSSETDIEEPAKIRRDQEEATEGPSGDDSDSPDGSSGSMSYEDKYDSDKEEPRSSSSSARASATPSVRTGEPAPIVDGLVNVGLNEDCLQCICRASSGCDHQLRCITRGSDERYCGPFQLTEDYWTSAGSPGDASNNFSSFEDCANEADCAVETVTNYMKKHHKDCDNDENITCMDYARLHILKPDECDNTNKLIGARDAYWAKFQRCAEGYNRSRTADDEDI